MGTMYVTDEAAEKVAAVDEIRWDRIAEQARHDADPWAVHNSGPNCEDLHCGILNRHPLGMHNPGPDAELTGREKLLAHYATREPTQWMQYDADHQPGGDGLATDDQNGDITYAAFAEELWSGAFPVRIHIKHGTDKTTAARLIRKVAQWVEEGPDDPAEPFVATTEAPF